MKGFVLALLLAFACALPGCSEEPKKSLPQQEAQDKEKQKELTKQRMETIVQKKYSGQKLTEEEAKIFDEEMKKIEQKMKNTGTLK